MKKSLIIISITVGILSGLWQILTKVYDNSNLFELKNIAVAGFLGWSTYFAAGGKKEGLILGLTSNISGVFWAIVSVLIGMIFKIELLGLFIGVTISAFMMCFQSHIKLFKFIPGSFIGSCTFFALGGNISVEVILPAILGLVIGIFLGLLSDKVSLYFINK